jgi:hypothetical protein
MAQQLRYWWMCSLHNKRLAVNVKDKILVAQFDDSLAKLFIATNNLKEAETAASRSVRGVGQKRHANTLADSLITHGIVLARLHKTDQAQFIFQRAIELSMIHLTTHGIIDNKQSLYSNLLVTKM